MVVKQKIYDPEKPHAWITKNRGRKSIKFENKIYLENGENFEIELFNPLTESVLADIKINGSSVSSSGLVLRPGERFYLDCFIDNRKKFVFETYEVEDNIQSKKAIEKNGLVEIFFYKEKITKIKDWNKNFSIIIEKYYPTYPWIYPYPSYTTYPYPCMPTYTSDTYAKVYGNSSLGYSNNISFNTTNTLNTSNYMDHKSNNIETGRVVSGEKSSQKFKEIEMDFESNYISSIIYQILPESQKPVETKELLKKTKSKKIKELELEIKELKKLLYK